MVIRLRHLFWCLQVPDFPETPKMDLNLIEREFRFYTVFGCVCVWAIRQVLGGARQAH